MSTVAQLCQRLLVLGREIGRSCERDGQWAGERRQAEFNEQASGLIQEISGALAKPATVITKARGDSPPVYYLIGPQRETRKAAEADLASWRAVTTPATPSGDRP